MSSSSLSIVGGLTPEQSSRDKLARLAGLLYFSTLPTGALGLIGAQSLLEKGGLAAVPQIVARRLFLELGVLSGALCVAIWLVVAVLFYVLFRSVGDRACKLLVVFALVGCTLLLAAIARRMDALSLVAQSRELALGADQLRKGRVRELRLQQGPGEQGDVPDCAEHQEHAQGPRQEARSKHQKSQRREPEAPENGRDLIEVVGAA